MSPALLSTKKNIIQNTDKYLTVHFSAVANSFGGDTETSVTVIDLSDASGYKQNGSALSADGFADSAGNLPTSLKILRLYASTGINAINNQFAVQLEFNATANVPIASCGEMFDTNNLTYFDFTPFGGLRNPRTSGANGDIVMTVTGAGQGGEIAVCTIQCLKVY
jgi:hypothetical protein